MGCHQSLIGIDSRGQWTEAGSSNEASVKMVLCKKKGRRWARRLIECAVWLPESTDEEESSSENNRAWLLGPTESVPGVSEEPQSIHSSFRFSFGSQAEIDTIAATQNSNATVLLLNLETSSVEKTLDFQKRRIQSLERSISTVSESLVRFSFAQMQSATRNFSPARVLGRGAYSCVYRGKLRLERTVAIKRLNNYDKENVKDFCRELMIASSLDNRFVVPLLGFCADADGLFLVYKFVSGGSLEHHLHDKKGRRCLPWSERYKVAIGVAQAVAYLHYGAERCVLHRDIKPSNILLSSKKTPKLCDFGLATWTSAASIPFLCKTVKGTFGYLSPEYFQHGKVSDKTDVYAFGVVLLELITGRKPIDTRRSVNEESLVQWTRPLLRESAVEQLVDSRLRRGAYSLKQVGRMVRAAAACVSYEELSRPSIVQVIKLLQGEEDLGLLGEQAVFAEMDGCAKNDMKGHLALAMLDVDDEDQNRR